MHTPTTPDRHLSREESAGYDRKVIDYIRNAAAHGLYEIRGLGAKRALPHQLPRKQKPRQHSHLL